MGFILRCPRIPLFPTTDALATSPCPRRTQRPPSIRQCVASAHLKRKTDLDLKYLVMLSQKL